MAPRSFMRVTEMFVSHDPTPAVRPKGGTLSSAGGPCLSGASWSALRRLASILSNEARRGVSGFGSFCRNKRASPAGAKPGNTENHGDTRVGDISAMRSPASAFSTGTTQDGFPIHIINLSGQNHILRMIRSFPFTIGPEKNRRAWATTFDRSDL